MCRRDGIGKGGYKSMDGTDNRIKSWKYYGLAEAGQYHKKQELLCQDYIHYFEKGTIQAITLADGTGENNLAKVGAEQSCKTLSKLLAEHFDELFVMEDSLIRFQVITNVQTRLYELCDHYHLDLKNFHSTLLGIVIDNEREVFMAVHLGDGSIGVKKDERMVIMSYPENGVNKSQTYLTSIHKAGKHMKIIKGEIKNIREFILVSDGWNEKTGKKNPFIRKTLFEDAKRGEYVDDVSFIALSRREEYN